MKIESPSWMPTVSFASVMKVIGVLFILALIGLMIFRIMWVNHIEPYEFAYQFDSRNGKITILTKKGYVVTPPFVVEVYAIDTRPYQIRIETKSSGSSVNNRVLNAKLVSFNPKGFDELVKLHGMVSGDVSEILKIYAYDPKGRQQPFLNIEDQTGDITL